MANAKPVYKRILLVEWRFAGTEGFCIDASILDRMAQEIKELAELGIQVGGDCGGNLCSVALVWRKRYEPRCGRPGDAGDRNERPGNA